MTMKFDFGQVICPIELKEVKQSVPCTGCEETGTIILRDGREWECPVCNGAKKIRKVVGKKWMPVRPVFSAASFKVEEIAMLGIHDNKYRCHDSAKSLSIRCVEKPKILF